MGDYNLNIMNHTNELTGEFSDVMYSKMFFPLITRPTRITSHTATLTDNIFSNNMDNFAKCGLLVNDISDHLPIFAMLFNTSVDTLDNRRPLMYREKSFSNIDKSKNELTSVNWTELPNYNDPYNTYGGLCTSLLQFITTVFR